MKSFRRLPASHMPKSQYYQHIAIICALGLALILLAGMLSILINMESNSRDAYQKGVHVQKALSIALEEGYAQGQPTYVKKDNGSPETLNPAIEQEALDLSMANGKIMLDAYDTNSFDVMRFTFDDGTYLVSYDNRLVNPWTVQSKMLPMIRRTF